MSSMIELKTDARIYVAGHQGLVGSAIVRKLNQDQFRNLALRTRQELDLTVRGEVFNFFESTRPEFVIIAAAKVGGIAANIASPVDFLLDNLNIQNNLLEACWRFQVIKTVFLGSSCVYPRDSPQPMHEEYYMHGPVEPTNESYAIAKIAGIRLAHALNKQYGLNIICPMPCNVYGPGDSFDFEHSHVLSAIVRKLVEAKQTKMSNVTLWGTGQARREFLHVDDLADACMFLLKHYDSPELINVGSGVDFSIRELAEKIASLISYDGRLDWDTSKPDGMPRKLLDVSQLSALGWRSKIGLEQGIQTVLEDFTHRYPEL
jgi:GDP-L-fucose synthase